jgi:hypothetical protein
MAKIFKKGSQAAKDHMAKVRAAKKVSGLPAKIVKQKGSSNTVRDKLLKALPPGIRKSKKSGNYYSEVRKNRSDKPGTLTGLIGSFFDPAIIKSLDDLKQEYKKLAMKFHPDKGGTTEQMQRINAEYEKMRNSILRGSKMSDSEQKNEIEIDETIRSIIDVLILIPGVDIELIGKWIWVSGNTYPVRIELKNAGLVFIKKAGVPYWVYKGVESSSRGKTDIEDIRKKYGSHKFDMKPPKSIKGIKKTSIPGILRKKLQSNLKKLTLLINKRYLYTNK